MKPFLNVCLLEIMGLLNKWNLDEGVFVSEIDLIIVKNKLMGISRDEKKFIVGLHFFFFRFFIMGLSFSIGLFVNGIIN